MASLLTGLALLYLACVGLFHASPSRFTLTTLGNTGGPPQYLRALSWGLALVGLLVLSTSVGFERGFTQWAGLFGLAGGISLFIVSRWPRHHEQSALIAGAIGLTSFSISVMAGAV